MKTIKLPVGVENFEEIRTEGFYYADKTGLIRELLNNWGKVNLFTRPRRFGKSLNMSMLRYFFEIGCSSTLFDGLEIAQEKSLCEKYMGKYPVISISLKDTAGNNFETAQDMLCFIINEETRRILQHMTRKPLTRCQQDIAEKLQNPHMGSADLMNALFSLSSLLYGYYDKKTIILIDEYDVPLDKAFDYGYYDQMVTLLRNMFSKALKTNDYLYFAVLTGCLRVSKESIFTGLNNMKVLSITNVRYDEYFGFTDGDVHRILKNYGLETHYEDIKKWYNGYKFGNVSVYCPWDVINYCEDLLDNPNIPPKSYWTNTSSNSIVKRLIQNAGQQTRREIEQLIAGESISKSVNQELTYSELDHTIDNLWSVLFTTGYLTQKGTPEGDKFQLIIPNFEVRDIFITQIKEWFQEEMQKDNPALWAFYEAFLEGRPEEIEQQFNNYLMKTISIRDTYVPKMKKENFYHGVLLGLLSNAKDWCLSSNAEAGEGYSDILIEIEEKRVGIVIEVKYSENDALEAGCVHAMRQIKEKEYVRKLHQDGMKVILAYGIACYRKHCKVVLERL